MQASTSARLQRFIGTPWISGGRDPVTGCDCWGLILAAARECFGLELPDYVGYTEADDVTETAKLFTCRAQWSRVAPLEVRPGDVVVLRLRGTPSHAGLIVDTGLMLHSLRGRDACIERYYSLAWAERIEGFYRWAR